MVHSFRDLHRQKRDNAMVRKDIDDDIYLPAQSIAIAKLWSKPFLIIIL